MGFRAGRKSQLPFVLLKPVVAPPQLENLHVCLGESDLREFFAGHNFAGDYMAFDIETKGNQVFDPESVVVGFSLADARGAGYWTAEHWPVLLNLLSLHSPRLIAHNVFFDGAYVMRDGNGLWPSFAYCTYGLYKQMATEGWPGQRWGLKDVQKQLLGWEETNERDLLEWLVQQGYQTATRKSIDDVVQKEDWFLTTDGVYAKANKGEMWRAPAEVLGKYCALDAHATYLFLTKVLLPGVQRFTVLNDYHQEVFLTNVRILIEQELSGMACNVAGLKAHAEHLKQEVARTADIFLAHPEIAPVIAQYNKGILCKHVKKEPRRYTENRQSKEPPKYKKDGKLTKRWIQWSQQPVKEPEPTKRWLQWETKRQELAATNHFNLNSGPQLGWLFYNQLNKPVLLTTETGTPAVDGKAMGMWGEPGTLLKKRSKAEKELGYVDAAIGYQRNGIIHPQFRVPGTLTGRLSGSGGLNMQQQPKTREYLSQLHARPGTVWVDFDHCLHPRTEALTKRGWVPILEVTAEDEVWQVNHKTLEGAWTVPLRVVKKHYAGIMYTFGNRRGSLSVTENHRMLWAGQPSVARKKNARWKTLSQEGLPSSGAHLPISSEYVSCDAEYNKEEIALICMLQADASKGTKSTGTGYTLQLRRERKVKQAESVLGRKGKLQQDGKTWVWCGIHHDSKLLDHSTVKLFNLSLLPLSAADYFVSQLQLWDGHAARSGELRWSTTSKHNAEEVQQYLVRAGYEAKLTVRKYTNSKFSTLYILVIRKSSRMRLRECDITTEHYDGAVGCVTVETGYFLVRSEGQTFVTGNCALEPCVLTELSRDPNMLKLYGPTAKSNDIYIFVGSAIPGIKEAFTACGYNPDNPTKESISRIKKEHKVLRSICKVVTLSAQYGAGPRKIHETLKLQGIQKELEEVQNIHRAYWQLFAGIKEYEKFLLGMWQRNGGWILNGVGRPLALHRDRVKDLVNSVCQSTGHDLHMIGLSILEPLLAKAFGKEFRWIIADFHDEAIIEVPQGGEQVVIECFREMERQLNEQLKPYVPIKIDPAVGTSLADFKISE